MLHRRLNSTWRPKAVPFTEFTVFEKYFKLLYYFKSYLKLLFKFFYVTIFKLFSTSWITVRQGWQNAACERYNAASKRVFILNGMRPGNIKMWPAKESLEILRYVLWGFKKEQKNNKVQFRGNPKLKQNTQEIVMKVIN